MHKTKKGNQWYSGMKSRIGVDADSRLNHKLIATAANVRHTTQARALLHSDETTAFGDADHQGVEKRQENQRSAVTWIVALHPGKRRALPETKTSLLREQFKKHTVSVRAKVAHPFHVIRNLFGRKKARYRGISENAPQLYTHFGLAKMMIIKRRLF
jgi:IS5 family transposase